MKKRFSESKKTESLWQRFWWFVVFVFLMGFVAGYMTHYLIVNWHGFFVTCDDGRKPDAHGCCGGEIYTDAGNGWMVCCPIGGETCFPPLR